MSYALCWFLVFALWALWSLTVWVTHAAALWATQQAGAWSGGAAGALSLPDALAAWLPAEFLQLLERAVASLAPLLDSLLQAAPSLAGALTGLAWVAWAVGSVLLLLLGAGLHALMALWRRHGRGALSAAGRSLAAR